MLIGGIEGRPRLPLNRPAHAQAERIIIDPNRISDLDRNALDHARRSPAFLPSRGETSHTLEAISVFNRGDIHQVIQLLNARSEGSAGDYLMHRFQSPGGEQARTKLFVALMDQIIEGNTSAGVVNLATEVFTGNASVARAIYQEAKGRVHPDILNPIFGITSDESTSVLPSVRGTMPLPPPPRSSMGSNNSVESGFSVLFPMGIPPLSRVNSVESVTPIAGGVPSIETRAAVDAALATRRAREALNTDGEADAQRILKSPEQTARFTLMRDVVVSQLQEDDPRIEILNISLDSYLVDAWDEDGPPHIVVESATNFLQQINDLMDTTYYEEDETVSSLVLVGGLPSIPTGEPASDLLTLREIDGPDVTLGMVHQALWGGVVDTRPAAGPPPPPRPSDGGPMSRPPAADSPPPPPAQDPFRDEDFGIGGLYPETDVDPFAGGDFGVDGLFNPPPRAAAGPPPPAGGPMPAPAPIRSEADTIAGLVAQRTILDDHIPRFTIELVQSIIKSIAKLGGLSADVEIRKASALLGKSITEICVELKKELNIQDTQLFKAEEILLKAEKAFINQPDDKGNEPTSAAKQARLAALEAAKVAMNQSNAMGSQL